MKVLLIGGGGREHALGWKIAQSPSLSKLYLVPGNPGLNQIGETLDVKADDIGAIVAAAQEVKADLVIVGPEAPLADGLGDALRLANIPCFGPDKAAAMLETSKQFMKEVCDAVGAPTAGYKSFQDPVAAKKFLDTLNAPFVIKADGLAAGKGVIIAPTREEAEAAIDDMLSGQFGAASETIVIEEFMEGEEASFFALTDGETVLPLAGAQDHKRAFDGDEGPNTGGMGAYSPAPVLTAEIEEITTNKIVRPIVDELRRRGTPYVGVIYAGLMIKDGAPRLVEINARFGDPECQILMRRLKGDVLPLLFAAATGDLKNQTPEWSDDAAALVVMATEGYPGSYEKGSRIRGIEEADQIEGVVVFHAGTETIDGDIRASGGRVLNITATGPTIRAAIERAYAGVSKIDWPEGFYRKDIGWRAL